MLQVRVLESHLLHSLHRASLRDTLSLHHKVYVLAGPTLGKSYGITYQKRVPGAPNPWNNSCAVNSCDPNWVLLTQRAPDQVSAGSRPSQRGGICSEKSRRSVCANGRSRSTTYHDISLYISLPMYIYIYREREREHTYIYITNAKAA